MKSYAVLGPIVASLLCVAPAWAQAADQAPPAESEAYPEYPGFVIDPMGAPVADAKISIPALGVEVMSSDTGEVLVRAPAGKYRVIVSREGFEPYEQEVVFDDATAATGFEVLLAYAIEEVVVTGTKVERLEEEAPVKTQVVSRERIERREAATLADALEGTTGVRVESDCQNCGFTQLRLNGLEGRYTQILIDGRPVFSTLAGVYGLEQIPQEMIDRIE
ncbi:MAG: TonB-dependent receptor, partial [Myxococcota bacterium]